MLERKTKEIRRKFFFINYLKEKIGLTDYQCEKLDEIFYDMPYEIKEIIEKKNVSLWWRLSIIPFFINYFILIIYLPIHWIFTGKNYYDINYMKKWNKKIEGEV